MELTWHGHATWYVTVGETDLIVDPFFDNPKTDLEAEDVDDPDYVLLTHGHFDHVADAAAFPDATVVATPELAGYAAENFGLDNAVAGMGMNMGGTAKCGDAWATMVRADHTNGIESDYEYSAGTPAGFVISDTQPTREADSGSTSFYHAGDTSLMVAMREVIGPFLQPDFAALPAGDHFTMGPAQAAVAADWVGADYAAPMHYDTFPPIEIDPSEFERELRATGAVADAVILEGDESFTLD